MNAILQHPGQDERTATATEPMPLARHDAGARQQTWLDRDPLYRWLVVAAVAIAFVAGSGYGLMTREVGWMIPALWALTAAGIATRLSVPRTGVGRGVADLVGLRFALRSVAILTMSFAALASARSGSEAMIPIGVATAFAALIWFASSRSPVLSLLTTLLSVAAGAAIPIYATGPIGTWQMFVVGGGGAVMGALVAYTTRARGGLLNPAIALTRLAGVAWAFLTWGARLQEWTDWFAFIGVCLVLSLLEFFVISRRYFAPTIVAVVLVHLAALPPEMAELHTPLWLQLPAATIEFALLIMAGLIHAGSQVQRLPTATYRISPLCIVPRLDRAWDHPVKINVV